MSKVIEQPAPVKFQRYSFPRPKDLAESPLEMLVGDQRLANQAMQYFVAAKILSWFGEYLLHNSLKASDRFDINMQQTFPAFPQVENSVMLENWQGVVSDLQQLREMRPKLERALDEIRELRTAFDALSPRVVMIREVNEDMAEREVTQYLEEHGHADTGELVEKLGIDIDIVLKVIQHLKAEGKVEGVGSH
jgi:hypothetical protein